jgi:hypothetical protein
MRRYATADAEEPRTPSTSTCTLLLREHASTHPTPADGLASHPLPIEHAPAEATEAEVGEADQSNPHDILPWSGWSFKWYLGEFG